MLHHRPEHRLGVLRPHAALDRHRWQLPKESHLHSECPGGIDAGHLGGHSGPGYPQQYGNSQGCTLHLSGARAQGGLLEVQHFDTASRAST